MTKTFFLRTTIAIAICLLTNVAYSQCEPVSAFPWTEGFENNDTNLPRGEWTLLKAFFTWEVGDIPDWQKSTILLPEKSEHYQIAFGGIFLGGGIADVQLDDISISESGEVGITKTDVLTVKLSEIVKL